MEVHSTLLVFPTSTDGWTQQFWLGHQHLTAAATVIPLWVLTTLSWT